MTRHVKYLFVAVVASGGVPVVGAGLQGQAASPRPNEVAIGTLDGEHDAFAELSDVMVAPNGLIVVLDRVEQRVAAFDQQGRYQWSYGRAGGGPGEFRWPARIVLLSDSTAGVVDVARGRIVELLLGKAQAKFIRERPGPASGSFMCMSGGRLAVSRYSASGSSVAMLDVSRNVMDSLRVLDLSTFGPGADDVAFSSPIGCGQEPGTFAQLNGSTGQLVYVNVVRGVRLETSLPDFRGFTVTPGKRGEVIITTPLDRHSAPWQLLRTGNGAIVIPMQDRRTTGVDRKGSAPVFETLATYAYVVTVGSQLAVRRVDTPGLVRAIGAGVVVLDRSKTYPRLVIEHADIFSPSPAPRRKNRVNGGSR